MIAQPRKIYYAFDDFMTLIKDKEKADLIDGVIYMASPESLEANELFLWLVTVMRLPERRVQLYVKGA